jgi:hypothetical protein
VVKREAFLEPCDKAGEDPHRRCYCRHVLVKNVTIESRVGPGVTALASARPVGRQPMGIRLRNVTPPVAESHPAAPRDVECIRAVCLLGAE